MEFKVRIKTTISFVFGMPTSTSSVFPTNSTVQQKKIKHVLLFRFIMIGPWKLKSNTPSIDTDEN